MPTPRRKRIGGLLKENATTVFDRLPHEIILHVFESGLSASTKSLDHSNFLWTLVAVCGLWKDLAMSMPSLWTRIEWVYTHPARSADVVDTRMAKVDAYLERSKTSQLDIILEVADDDDETRERLWASVLPHMARCRSFELSTGIHGRVDLFFPLPGKLEHLRKIDIDVEASSDELPLFEENIAAPLETVTLHHPLSLSPFSLAHLPTKRITRVKLVAGGSSLKNALEFLSRCDVIASFDLTLDAMFTPSVAPRPPILRPHLKALKLTNIEMFCFAKMIHAPHLEELTLAVGERPLRGLWTRSDPEFTFTTLRLVRVEARNWSVPSPDAISALLVSNPAITDLCFTGWPETFALLQKLLPAPTPTTSSAEAEAEAASAPSEEEVEGEVCGAGAADEDEEASQTETVSESPQPPIAQDLARLRLRTCFPPNSQRSKEILTDLLTSRSTLQVFVDKSSLPPDVCDGLTETFGERFQIIDE